MYNSQDKTFKPMLLFLQHFYPKMKMTCGPDVITALLWFRYQEIFSNNFLNRTWAIK